MKKVHVVIGAGFGDEGKGLMVNYFAQHYGAEALVVRFNGSAQAGHTVVLPDSQRHVFSHFGSGTFAGATTYLSRFFVCHPMLFRKERGKLLGKLLKPRVLADGNCPVTTPYDMILNQALERSRGGTRHGSCGVGFGETLERHGVPEGVPLYARDLNDPVRTQLAMSKIRLQWMPYRLQQLHLTLSEVEQELVDSKAIESSFLADCAYFYSAVEVTLGNEIAAWPVIIFEGAQGLLLDQDSPYFPYVTRSHTGLTNVAALLGGHEIADMEVTYVTRCYLTRHGAGPLPGELPAWPFSSPHETNKANEYQGALRFAWLDLDLLATAVRKDVAMGSLPRRGLKQDHLLSLYAHAPQGRSNFAITCLDQLDNQNATLIKGGSALSCHPDRVSRLVENQTGFPVHYEGWNPSTPLIRDAGKEV